MRQVQRNRLLTSYAVHQIDNSQSHPCIEIDDLRSMQHHPASTPTQTSSTVSHIDDEIDNLRPTQQRNHRRQSAASVKRKRNRQLTFYKRQKRHRQYQPHQSQAQPRRRLTIWRGQTASTSRKRRRQSAHLSTRDRIDENLRTTKQQHRQSATVVKRESTYDLQSQTTSIDANSKHRRQSAVSVKR